MAVHPTSGYAAFSMWALADAVSTGNYATQDAQAPSGQDYFAQQLAVLKGIDFGSVDTVVIHYGTNDFTGNVAIDNDTDDDDTSTLCGALRYALRKIQTAYPKIRIFISLPIYRKWDSTGAETYTNANGKKLREFCTALAGVADEFNCPCIDGYKALGINTANASAFLADGAHLNEHGRKVFGEYIGGCLIAPSGTESQEMPTTLPNPNALTFTGAVTGSYDGSAPLSVEIPDGGSGGYNLPVASATQLGGVMPVAKTDEMTQAVGVDEAGGLWALPGGASRSWRLVGTVDFAELYNQGVTSFEYALSSPDAIYMHQENITNDNDKTNSRLQLQYDGITLGENAIPTRNKNVTQNKFNNLCWYFDGAFAKAEKSSEAIGINYSFSTLNAMYTLLRPYDGYPKTIRGAWSNIPGAFDTIISGTLEIWARELI